MDYNILAKPAHFLVTLGLVPKVAKLATSPFCPCARSVQNRCDDRSHALAGLIETCHVVIMFG